MPTLHILSPFPDWMRLYMMMCLAALRSMLPLAGGSWWLLGGAGGSLVGIFCSSRAGGQAKSNEERRK
jgi:hypothetical protein